MTVLGSDVLPDYCLAALPQACLFWRGGHRIVLLFVGMVSFLVHLFVLQLTDFWGQHENDTMCGDRGIHQRVYLKNTTNATKKPSNFASSLIFLLLMYKRA
jgi:hypothetical protein